jgi:hypothetical protein
VALAEGLQNALWALGRTPLQHRSDSLSAAFRNLAADTRQDQTWRYEALCAHYRMAPTRQQSRLGARERLDRKPAWPSETGDRGRAVAARLARFRHARGLSPLLDEIVGRRNARNGSASISSAWRCRHCRRAGRRITRRTIVTVTSTSGFTLKKVFYSVPSRLIGHRLRVRL